MILPLLSGLASGASETYGKIAEAERTKKTANDRLVADALFKKAEDPTLLPEEAGALHQEAFKRLGMDKATMDAIGKASGFLRQAVNDHISQNGPPPAGGMPTGGQVQGQGRLPESLGSVPTQGQPQATSGQGLPPLPQFPGPHTMGDIREYQQNKSDIIKGMTKNITDARELSSKIDAADSEVFNRTGQHLDRQSIITMAGGTPRFRPPTSGFVPGYVTGKDAKLETETDEANNPIDEAAVYRRAKDQLGNPTSQFTKTAARANPGEWINDADSSTGFSHLFRDSIQGNIIKVERNILPPASYLQNQTTTTRQVFKVVQQPDGSSQLIPVQESSTNASGKDIPGGVPPVKVPGQSAAPGAALPKATSITPSSPLPTAPGGLGQPVSVPQGPNPYGGNIRVGTVVGGKPLGEGEFRNLNNAKQGLRAIQIMESYLTPGSPKYDPNILKKAALPGAIGAQIFDNARKEAADVITRLRTGAALNEEEQVFYGGQMPGLMNDIGEHFEPGVIQAKLDLYKNLYNGVIQQYGRRAVGGYKPGDFPVGPTPGGNVNPTTPIPLNPDVKIEVTDKNGDHFRITQAGIDAAKRDGVILTPVAGKK